MEMTEATLTPQQVVASGDLANKVGTPALQIQAPGGQTTSTARYLVAWRRQADGRWGLAVDIWNTDAQA
jgi:ketosteroid isomerase-like protein